jgi:nucleoside-diphosphate-sugar epimerase
MNVLVTGANGYIGQAVCAAFQAAGHRVAGLVRTPVAAATVRARGVRPVPGSLDAVEAVADEIRQADAVVDTASADHAEATEAFLAILAGSGATYVRTSGTGVYTDLAHGTASDHVYTEESPFTPAPVVSARVVTDERVRRASALRTVVLRPSMIFGDGASEQLPLLIRTALTTGRSLYVGAGDNRWSNVHLGDLAAAYLLAVEKAPAGSVYNLGTGEARLRDIAEGVARLLGLPGAESCPPEVAYAAFGQRWVDVALSSNSRVDSTLARAELGWDPQGPDLLDDLVSGSYRRVWAHKGDPHDHTSPSSEGASS